MAEEVPTDDAVDWILNDLENKPGAHTDGQIARQAQRLRAYIEALRDPSVENLIRDLAETPTADETPGVAADDEMDMLICCARAWVRMKDGA